MNELKQDRDAWVVMTNTDLTEGKGAEFPLCVCELEATAIRMSRRAYIMGSDAPVKAVRLTIIDGYWYGPVHVTPPSDDDRRAERDLALKREAVRRAKAAGLSDDDIKALRL